MNPEQFWGKIEGETGAPIPVHIRNICAYNGLDNPIGIQAINEEVIKDLEHFAKNEMVNFIKPEENLENYFGLYSNNTQNFKSMWAKNFC